MGNGSKRNRENRKEMKTAIESLIAMNQSLMAILKSNSVITEDQATTMPDASQTTDCTGQLAAVVCLCECACVIVPATAGGGLVQKHDGAVPAAGAAGDRP